MKVKELREVLSNLPDEMTVASLNNNETYVDAIAYIDGTGDEDVNHPMEWLVISGEKEVSE